MRFAVRDPVFGYLSDRIGRKRMYLIGAATLLVFVFPYYAMIDTRIPAGIFCAVVLSLPVHDMQYAPQAAFIAESFPADVRYSGSSLGYQLASITAGGPAPLLAAWLIHTFHTSLAVSIYLAVLAVISIVAASMLRDRSHDDYAATGWDDLSAGITQFDQPAFRRLPETRLPNLKERANNDLTNDIDRPDR
jgi:MFS family permease